jgi:hypothetical protein
MGGVCATCGGADLWTGFCGVFGDGAAWEMAKIGHKARTATAKGAEKRMKKNS